MRPYSELVEYWFGEREQKEDAELEEHLFACAECSARLEELAALGAGIRSAFRAGALQAVLPAAFVERLKREGVRLREYRVAPGASVNCTLGADDDFVLSRLQAPLAGVGRLDLVVLGGETLEDIPFDPAAGEVLFLPGAAELRRRPAHVERVRLIADGARALGDYTFVHTPS